MGDDWELAKMQIQLERDKFEFEVKKFAWVMEQEVERLNLDKYEAETRRMSLEAGRG